MKSLLAQSALTKVIVLGLLILFAGLPLAHISGLISERGQSRQQAAHELAVRHAGPQVVAGPMLVIPYTERWIEEQQDEKGLVKARIARSKQRAHIVFRSGRISRAGSPPSSATSASSTCSSTTCRVPSAGAFRRSTQRAFRTRRRAPPSSCRRRYWRWR